LVKRKNVDTVIRAVSLLPRDIQDNYKLLIIGDGPEKQGLVDLAYRLNLKNVEFLGELFGKRKFEWLCRARIFILCPMSYESNFESGFEGFGIAYIEAQAAGLPVIGTDQGGIPESVGDGGLLVKNPTNPQEIVSCIQKLITDNELYKRYQINALSRVKYFDRKIIFRQFEQVYERALNHV
jgi:phosphatidylinositol alpha-1,6-mannosyltransferase